MSGIFITIYGINNIGKTYHAKRLVDRLTKLGKKAVYIKYPIYDLQPTGPLINKILRSHRRQKISEEELQLWFVLNRYQFQPQLKKLLSKGTIVIAEDYVGTGIGWGMAKSKRPKTAQRELENMNKFLVQEDCSIMLDGERRLSSREEKHLHEQDDRLAARTQKIFRKLAKKYSWNIVKIAVDKDVTAARIWKLIKQKV